MNKSILFITIAVLVVGVLFSVMSIMNFQPTTPYKMGNNPSSGRLGQVSQNSTTLPVGSQNPNSAPVSQTPSTTISMAVLSQHNSESDCWVGYQGKAYDLTSWLPRHPGSAGAISPYCGTAAEFEQAFINQHGTRMASLFMKVAVYQGDLSG